jgi:flagellar hook assembly protein FlgD
VHITVFDLKGARVLERDLGALSPGHHTWRWDLRNGLGARVGPGTYLMQVHTASGAAQARRVVVR